MVPNHVQNVNQGYISVKIGIIMLGNTTAEIKIHQEGLNSRCELAEEGQNSNKQQNTQASETQGHRHTHRRVHDGGPRKHIWRNNV